METLTLKMLIICVLVNADKPNLPTLLSQIVFRSYHCECSLSSLATASDQQIDALARSGYATDSRYGEKIRGIIEGKTFKELLG